MAVPKTFSVSLLVIALLSTAGLAIAAEPQTPQTPGPGQEIEGDVPVTPDGKGIVKGVGAGGGVTLVARDIRGSVHWRARGTIKDPMGGGAGTSRVDSFFDVFFDITYRGHQEVGTFRAGSFFDVFTEFHPPDPGAGTPERIRGAATNDFEYKFVTPAGLIVSLSSFFDVFTEYSGGGGGGGTFTVASFFDVFLEISLPSPGAAGQVLASYSEMGQQANLITDDGRGGAMSQTDSFFDVFTELSAGPGGGSGQADSFFDVFLEVSRRGKERKQGGQQLEYRARSHTTADYEFDDKALLLDLHRGTTQVSKVTKIDAFTLKQKVTERDVERGTVAAGDSETRVDSFFDITYRIDGPGRPPVTLRGRGVWTGLATVHYEPPLALRNTAVTRNAAKGINSPNLLI